VASAWSKKRPDRSQGNVGIRLLWQSTPKPTERKSGYEVSLPLFQHDLRQPKRDDHKPDDKECGHTVPSRLLRVGPRDLVYLLQRNDIQPHKNLALYAGVNRRGE
jgi:hypothetical protein